MKKKKMNGNTVLLIITIVLFFVMYAVGCAIYANKGFTHLQTFLNVLINNAGLLCITCGMTCVMLTGGIDISVGSLVAMDCMFLAVGMERWNMNAVVLCILVLLIGVVFGIVQGFCVGYLNIQPFIVTMAGMFFARGMTAVICTDQVSISSNEFFVKLANAKIKLPFGSYVNGKGVVQVPFIRISVVVALVVLVVVFLMLRYTKFGRSLYAVGGSEQSATMMGLDVKKNKIKSLCVIFFPLFDRRYLLLLEYHVRQRAAGTWIRDGCHCIIRYRWNAPDRRSWKCDRFLLRCTDQRYNLNSGKDQW